MPSWSWKVGLAGAATLAVTAFAAAQMSGQAGMHDQMGSGGGDQPMMMSPPGGQADMHTRMMQMMQGRAEPSGMHEGAGHGMAGMQGSPSGQPTLPGQDAFGAIQEVVRILEADSSTDWSKVNITALREHLIDMNEVTLHAAAAERPLDNGIEIVATGEGHTLDAIKRMVPAHAAELAKMGWNAKTDDLPNGIRLMVTGNDPNQVTKLKALGFMGIMVQGEHQPHHLMIAKGEPLH